MAILFGILVLLCIAGLIYVLFVDADAILYLMPAAFLLLVAVTIYKGILLP